MSFLALTQVFGAPYKEGVMQARYWIVQYIDDLFRNEPKNIGVVAEMDNVIDARFFGEDDSNNIDGRKIRELSYPDVYRQWVNYWRDEIRNSNTDAIVKNSGSHYRVIEAGKVSDVGHDSIASVLDYLFNLLIDRGGFKKALSLEDETDDIITVRLLTEISSFMQERNILSDSAGLIVPHPVRRNVPIHGTGSLTHKPAFVQENGKLYVMESVDFTSIQRTRSKDHAGSTAYMFKDIKSNRTNTENIAIIKVTDADRENEEVEYGLKVLENESDVVNWLDREAREDFLSTREEIANTR